jgi:hypothetical protein
MAEAAGKKDSSWEGLALKPLPFPHKEGCYE